MSFSDLLSTLRECGRPGCVTKFIPSATQPDFCSDLCVLRARQQRGAVDTRPNYNLPAPVRSQTPKKVRKPKSTAVCPQKMKKVFVTWELAQDWIANVHPDDVNIRPYRCQCGAIHIGHSKLAGHYS